MDIQTEVQKALSRKDPPLSSKEALALRAKLRPVLTEVTGRHRAIHPGEGNIPMGKEYRQALESGTAEEVERLQGEFRQAAITLAQLEAKRDALAAALKASRIREAMEGLPKMQEAFVSRIEAAEAAHRAFEESLDALQATYTEIAQARGTLSAAGMHGAGAGADASVIGRLMALGALTERRRDMHHPDTSLHCSRLGAPSPRSQAEWQERQPPAPKRWVTA